MVPHQVFGLATSREGKRRLFAVAAAFRGDVSVAAGLVLTAKSGGLARFCCLPLAACRLLDVHLPMVPAQSAPSDFSWPMMAVVELFGLISMVRIRSSCVGFCTRLAFRLSSSNSLILVRTRQLPAMDLPRALFGCTSCAVPIHGT